MSRLTHRAPRTARKALFREVEVSRTVTTDATGTTVSICTELRPVPAVTQALNLDGDDQWSLVWR